MRHIVVSLNCLTEKEYYKTLGNLLVTQKLLNDYISQKSKEDTGPEGFAEDWMEQFGLSRISKDEVMNMFSCALLVIARSENS